MNVLCSHCLPIGNSGSGRGHYHLGCAVDLLGCLSAGAEAQSRDSYSMFRLSHFPFSWLVNLSLREPH